MSVLQQVLFTSLAAFCWAFAFILIASVADKKESKRLMIQFLLFTAAMAWMLVV